MTSSARATPALLQPLCTTLGLPDPAAGVWLLDDGRAGHTRLALGLVDAFLSVHAMLQEPPCQPLPQRSATPQAWFPPHRSAISLLRRASFFPQVFVRLARTLLPPAADGLPADAVLIGSGMPSLLLGQYWLQVAAPHGRLYWVGQPTRVALHPRTQTLYWHPAHLTRVNAHHTASPLLPAPRPSGQSAPVRWPPTLCIGGRTRECPFERSDWAAMLDQFARHCEQRGQRGQVLLSRRSPAPLLQELAQPWSQHFDLKSPDQVVLPGHFPAPADHQMASALWITADSLSMLNEAIWHGWPVQAITPLRGLLRSSRTLMLADWQQRGWITLHIL